MTPFESSTQSLRSQPKSWLVTGAAGFIGSHLVEALLRLDQRVTGLDNFATGLRTNLEAIRAAVAPEQWARFTMLEADIRDFEACRQATQGIDLVLHQAALGSVPRSVKDPLSTHAVNVDGFVYMLRAAGIARVQRFVYASSSSVYGDHPGLPKVEDKVGNLMSPYALSKAVGEQYAKIYSKTYGTEAIGLRYFNVFGARQDPKGEYAAVIPRWLAAMIKGEGVTIFGDGETSRDFSYVANVVQANILAATVREKGALQAGIFNVGFGERTTLHQLFDGLRDRLAQLDPRIPGIASVRPSYLPERPGDVRHSLADIGAARRLLGYEPTHSLAAGLAEAVPWYLAQAR